MSDAAASLRVPCIEGDHFARADLAARAVECSTCRYVVGLETYSRFHRYRIEALCYRGQLELIAAAHDPREVARLRRQGELAAEYHAGNRGAGVYDRGRPERRRRAA